MRTERDTVGSLLWCPYCNKATNQRVVDSRPATFEGYSSIRRRRLCQVCEKRTTTYEVHAGRLHTPVEHKIDAIDSIIDVLEKAKIQYLEQAERDREFDQ